MAKRHWNLGIIRLFNDVLYEEALSQTPNGLRYHLIDICVDELAKVNKNASLPLTEATFLDCLEPFFALAQKAEDKTVHKRVMDNVLMKFLNGYSFVSEAAAGEDEDAESLIFDQVHVGSVAKFIFEVASDNDTDERYRKALYEMHKTFVRQIRAAGRDVDLKNSEEEEEVDDDSFLKDACNLPDDEHQDSFNKSDVKEDVKEEQSAEEPAKTSAEKKKKKKKGKKKKKSKDADVAPETPSKKDRDNKHDGNEEEKTAKHHDNVSAVTPVKTAKDYTSISPSPKTDPSSKKKKTRENEAINSEVRDAGATPKEPAKEPMEETSNKAEKVKTKSSKKKRKKRDNEAIDLEAKGENKDQESKSMCNTPTPKRKKQEQKSPPSVDPRSMVDSDGVDKISLSSQKKSPSSSSPNTEAPNNNSASKRVSFGKMNHCKSYKASMKALKTLNQQVWSTANRTPDKSILYKKGSAEDTCKSSEKASAASSSRKKKGKRQV